MRINWKLIVIFTFSRICEKYSCNHIHVNHQKIKNNASILSEDELKMYINIISGNILNVIIIIFKGKYTYMLLILVFPKYEVIKAVIAPNKVPANVIFILVHSNFIDSVNKLWFLK